MSWFTRNETIETVIERTPGDAQVFETAVTEYRSAEAAWDQAKLNVRRYKIEHPKLDAVQVFNDRAVVRVNTLKNSDPQLNRLCAIEAEAKRVRNEKLTVKTNLEFRLGLKR
jgi:hypothetical protein